MSLEREQRVLVVGIGYAGRRFVRAVSYLECHASESIVLAGVCDVAPPPNDLGVPVFTSVSDACAALDPSAVVVAVSEDEHAKVLREVSRFGPPLILCEKPLTATLAETLALPDELKSRPVTVNFVERHSGVLGDYFDWAGSRPGLRPVRVEFFWGKHRVSDPRPTMGVLSEITHPLDIVDYLFGLGRFKVLSAHGTSSNFSPFSDAILDTINVLASTGEYTIVGAASFAWPRRHRCVTGLLVDDRECLFRVTIDFDSPKWDCDTVLVEEINLLDGSVGLVMERSTDAAMYPGSLAGVAKIAAYVTESLAYAESGVTGRVADYAQAVKIQRALDDIQRALDSVGATVIDRVTPVNRPAPEVARSAWLARQCALPALATEADRLG